jgi:hypothetical protein
VLIAVPEEKMIYYYAEGMMAPRGSYQNYSRVPVAIGVLDRSLRETGDGVYTTVVPIDYSGVVDVFVYLNQPIQMFGHFELNVEADPVSVQAEERNRPLAIPEPVVPTSILPVGEESNFRFRLVDPGTGEPVFGYTDVRIMVHASMGNWQRRLPAEAFEDGTYAVALRLRKTGEYQLHVQSPSLNLAYSSHRALLITATDDVEVGGARQQNPENPLPIRRHE